MLTLLEHLISPFNGGFMLFLFYFTDFANVRTSVLSVNDFGFGCFDIWTAFNVDECILG